MQIWLVCFISLSKVYFAEDIVLTHVSKEVDVSTAEQERSWQHVGINIHFIFVVVPVFFRYDTWFVDQDFFDYLILFNCLHLRFLASFTRIKFATRALIRTLLIIITFFWFGMYAAEVICLLWITQFTFWVKGGVIVDLVLALWCMIANDFIFFDFLVNYCVCFLIDFKYRINNLLSFVEVIHLRSRDRLNRLRNHVDVIFVDRVVLNINLQYRVV